MCKSHPQKTIFFVRPQVSNVVQVDACHPDNGGILQKACMQDAGLHTVELLDRFSAQSECDESWLAFAKQLLLLYPSLDNPKFSLMSDMAKGIENAFGSVFANLGRVICFDHMSGNVIKTAGSTRKFPPKNGIRVDFGCCVTTKTERNAQSPVSWCHHQKFVSCVSPPNARSPPKPGNFLVSPPKPGHFFV